jgi:hypothetical protein
MRTYPARSAGGASTEPPVLADPRRWGALVGVAGGLVFIFSYGPPLGAAISVAARAAGIGLAATALFRYYLRPASLGPFRDPRPGAVVVYLCCVAGELLAIAAGSRLLASLGRGDLRPALIAGVVGLHFLPFGWAFGERLFHRLGLALLVLGGTGLVAGYAGISRAGDAAAVLSGVVMLVLLVLHAQGRFAASSS